MSKKTLTIEYDYEFALFGLICQEKDYRLCHEVNKKLKLGLKKEKDLAINLGRQKEVSSFSFYTAQGGDGLNYYTYHLFSNRSSRGLLIPEQKQIDFFIMVVGEIPAHEKKELLLALKDIPIVMGTYELQPKELKSKENLIF